MSVIIRPRWPSATRLAVSPVDAKRVVHRDGTMGRACAVEAAGAVDASPADTSDGPRAHKLLGNHRTVSTAPTASFFLSIEILRYDWAAVEHVDGPRQVEARAVPRR